MRQKNDHPLGMMANPLVGMALDPSADPLLSEEMIQVREEQRDHELRLLGTMLFQAFFLSLCILLYERWEWSQFNSLYEAMIFWFTASFALQAGFYFIYRAGFEDSNSHRKGLRKMRQSNKRRLAMIKYQQEKRQLETVLAQQLQLFEQSYANAMSDGHIDQQENAMLGNQMNQLLATVQQLQGSQSQSQATPSQSQQLTPADVGLGRMDIMGLPIGPKLSISSLPDGGIHGGQATFQGGPPNQSSTLNLQPAGTQQEKEIKNAQALEAINESL